jgi:hypothetical protein
MLRITISCSLWRAASRRAWRSASVGRGGFGRLAAATPEGTAYSWSSSVKSQVSIDGSQAHSGPVSVDGAQDRITLGRKRDRRDVGTGSAGECRRGDGGACQDGAAGRTGFISLRHGMTAPLLWVRSTPVLQSLARAALCRRGRGRVGAFPGECVEISSNFPQRELLLAQATGRLCRPKLPPISLG